MHKTLAAAALAAAAIAPSAALAEPTARVEYRDAFTTRTPGTPSGRLFHDEFFDARDAGAKPPAVQHFTSSFRRALASIRARCRPAGPPTPSSWRRERPRVRRAA